MKTRIEQDSMGELAVPAQALYGAQTQRAINNFPISGKALPEAFIRALLKLKIAAAMANSELNLLDKDIAKAIIDSANELLGMTDLLKHFPIDVYQTGSGTSTNMNANEVLAHLASQRLGRVVGANDHVNFGQSSNDTIPSALHISAAIALQTQLLEALRHLKQSIEAKAKSVDCYVKTGRTHLMDAMPVRLSQSLLAWADQLALSQRQLEYLQTSLQKLAQGGTAVGTGINTHPQFALKFNQHLSQLTGIQFTPADNFFSHIASQDTVVALSGQLKTLAVSLMKISNDLRWMNSGPLAGLAEIELETLQPGSSIMPGKVNPVIPEAVAMVCAKVMGNDSCITIAGQSGNFEINVMLPVVADCLLDSLLILSNAMRLLADKSITSFTVNEKNLQQSLAKNPILVTALNPLIGYLKAAEIAKEAYKTSRPIIDVALEYTDFSRQELENLLDPKKLTFGGL